MLLSSINNLNFKGQVAQSQALESLINRQQKSNNNTNEVKEENTIQPQVQVQEKEQATNQTQEQIPIQTQVQVPIQAQAQMQNTQANIAPLKSDIFTSSQMPQQNQESIKQTLIKSGISIASSMLIIALSMKFLPKLLDKSMNIPIAGEEEKLWEDISSAAKINELILPDGLKEILTKTKNAIADPNNLQKRGGKPSGSILLYGPPGTGKTTFAKALAREFTDARFASIDITKLNSKYHGETNKRINHAIDSICKEAQAHPNTKFFVFIDEIDSVMMVDDGLNGKLSNDILNEFKKCFTEKLGKQPNIITIGATNFPIDVEKGTTATGKVLDRPMLDRFEQKILVDLPTSEQMQQAITAHYKGCELVDEGLKDGSETRLKKLCDFLAKKEHSVSFRTLNSIYNDTAARLTGDETVKFEDIVATIEAKKPELNITEKDWTSLMNEFGIPYTPKKETSGKIQIGFHM